jgi:hypothetical protein
MTLQVETGHVLVVDGNELPIVSVERWQLSQRASRAVARLANVSFSLKKESFTDGKGTEGIYSSGLFCSPLDPMDGKTKNTLGLETPHTLKETFIENDGEFIRLIVEDLRA